MENKQPQKEQPLENIIGGLRDDYVSHSPEITKHEAPKVGKQIHIGKPKNRWLLLLTALVILSGIGASVLLLNLGNDQNIGSTTETSIVIQGGSVENWEDYIDPTMPAATAVSLPEPVTESFPAEPTPALPEVTPWPTPPISPP